MTSGNFRLYPIASIKTNREERQRKELFQIDELADSIRRLGLIHPIIISPDGRLVAGERRLEACKKLGWISIWAQFGEKEEQFRAIELEENIKRVDLPWKEQCEAIEEYHRLQLTTEPNWTKEDTAASLGLSARWIGQILTVASQLGDTKIDEAPHLSAAVNVIRRREKRLADNELNQINELEQVPKARPDNILHADFNTWALSYSGPRFNFIHCDFPYGINIDKSEQGRLIYQPAYTDTQETYWRLLETLVAAQNCLFTESAHLMFWFSMEYYNETYSFLTEHLDDFVINKFPLVWMKTDGRGILPDAARGPRRIYETAFFGARGDRSIITPIANAYGAPTHRSDAKHISEKPEPVLRHFFRMIVDENTHALDPTCGSGNALCVVEEMKGTALGIELDEEFCSVARLNLKNNRALRTYTEVELV